MRIGIMAPPTLRTPPKHYGGMERIAYWLAEEFHRRGHEVILFAKKGSYCSGRTIHYSEKASGMENALLAASYSDEVDVYHSHTHAHKIAEVLPKSKFLLTLQVLSLPTVRRNLTCISEAQKKHLGVGPNAPVVYQFVPVDEYPSSNEKGRTYLIYMGSINPYKGVDIAIEVAKKARVYLKTAGLCWDMKYWEEYIRPNVGGKTHVERHIGHQIEYYGPVGGQEKMNLLKNALALIHPVRWCEAGAIVVLESLACGTPVIGSRNGVLPELVKHGETGWLVEVESDIKNKHLPRDGFIKGIEFAKKVDHAKCREVASQFDVSIAADKYFALYEKVLRGEGWSA